MVSRKRDPRFTAEALQGQGGMGNVPDDKMS